MRSARPVDRFAQFLYTEIAISAFSRSFTRFSYFHYFSHDTNTFRTFPEHVRSIAITLPRSPHFSEHLSNFFLIFPDFMQFYAIFRNFIRFSASFREFHILRVYPSFAEHIISDYRRLSPRFADFTLFYVRLLSISSRTPFMLSSYFRITPSLVILASTRRSFYFLVPFYFLLGDIRPFSHTSKNISFLVIPLFLV